MVVLRKSAANGLFEIGEINHHAVANLSLDGDFDFIRMPVKRAAFGMLRQKVSAVDVFDDADFHGEQKNEDSTHPETGGQGCGKEMVQGDRPGGAFTLNSFN
jgi:hypothetical protein